METLLLGNTFLRNEVGCIVSGQIDFSAASARLAKHRAVYLVGKKFWLGCDSFFEKVASQRLFRNEIFLIILAIFGLWLATI